MVRLNNNQNQNNSISPYRDVLKGLWNAKVMIILALAAVMVRLSYVSGQPEAAPPGTVTTSEVVNRSEELVGKSVTVRSKPLQTVGSTSFTVSDRQYFGGEPILVINASGQPFDLPSDGNTEVQITGEVRNLVLPDIEREFNLKLQEEYYGDYVGKPAIIARSITLAPAPAEIATKPNSYYGKKLVVTGAVENIQSPVLFSLQKNQLLDGSGLLVLLKTPPTVAINEGQIVAVVGVVRPFVAAEVEREYKVNWDLKVKRQLETAYKNRPILLAEAVYPSESL
ncbi:hypothetical protein [Fischerella sp. PCC 9605]|uniref:hypothetical protein n=1 Tax=Fischerella sp. PCC 9605 TaxID=1173024 RepID=UPI00047CEEEC|nr:hypothetical protein [Fischerella sp. PCC 9605]